MQLKRDKVVWPVKKLKTKKVDETSSFFILFREPLLNNIDFFVII
jgi:hypothetical protein